MSEREGPLFGIVAATVTPFCDDGSIDLQSWQRLLAYLAEAGIHGAFICGTTGEGPLLTADERIELTATAVRSLARGGVHVAVQVGMNTTGESIETARRCVDAGADALALVTPSYWRYPEELVRRHFATVLSAVPETAVYLYNLPGHTGNSFDRDLVLDLQRSHGNLAGVKDSSKDFDVTDSFISAGIETLTGTDGQIAPALLVGAVGAVCAVASCEPEVAIELWRAWERRDLDAVRSYHRAVVEARARLKSGPPLVRYKEVLVRKGVLASAVMRGPLGQP